MEFYFALFYNSKSFSIQNSNMPNHIRYAKIALEKRQKLVKMVLEDGWTINKARKKLGIKPSTAKLIIKKYKTTGTFSSRNQQGIDQTDCQEPQIDLTIPNPIYNSGVTWGVNPEQWASSWPCNWNYSWILVDGTPVLCPNYFNYTF